jgi:hypothetical protein
MLGASHFDMLGASHFDMLGASHFDMLGASHFGMLGASHFGTLGASLRSGQVLSWLSGSHGYRGYSLDQKILFLQ